MVAKTGYVRLASLAKLGCYQRSEHLNVSGCLIWIPNLAHFDLPS